MAVNKTRTPIGEQNPNERVKNFGEVCLGYTEDEGREEAARCLQCRDAPCVESCPVSIDIPAFILAIKDGDMTRAADVMSRYTNLPAVCGRVCPQETQCEGVCRLGRAKGFEPVAIGKLERLVADRNYSRQSAQKAEGAAENGKIGRVAVVGSGPSGLTVAGDLVKMGYDVTIFEALHAPGGVLMYGIPEFRLPKSIVEHEIRSITNLGVKLVTNAIVGRTITIGEIESGFDACFIGVGAGAPRFQGIPGTALNGVSSASEYLTRINLMRGYEFPDYNTPIKKSKRVVIIGGGNVAMDAARSAMRLGADAVGIIYRRSEAELPARVEEYHHALEEGISFHWLSNPTEYADDGTGSLKGVTCEKMELGEPDASGRRRPVPIPGSEFFIEADTAIEAIGQEANKVLLSACPGLKLNKRGYIEANPDTGETSVQWIFAGGDIVTGAATVILAMGAGKASAMAIDRYVRSRKAQSDDKSGRRTF
ncbi:MAG: NADPH-dependent glutamate synthase [Synergistaceae bacterium]|jgi:glutamate synthase (NADPH/NADH) small chain|nr:NADPH-dependent glutamate synthase [Synergistaceae bacterium]